jgi:hypothetical protein
MYSTYLQTRPRITVPCPAKCRPVTAVTIDRAANTELRPRTSLVAREVWPTGAIRTRAACVRITSTIVAVSWSAVLSRVAAVSRRAAAVSRGAVVVVIRGTAGAIGRRLVQTRSREAVAVAAVCGIVSARAGVAAAVSERRTLADGSIGAVGAAGTVGGDRGLGDVGDAVGVVKPEVGAVAVDLERQVSGERQKSTRDGTYLRIQGLELSKRDVVLQTDELAIIASDDVIVVATVTCGSRRRRLHGSGGGRVCRGGSGSGQDHGG